MTSHISATEFDGVLDLPPNAAINHALGANHDLDTGLDELIDNAIDAGATNIAIVLHVDGHRLQQISIHDDGRGMSQEKITEVLRLGGHSAQSETNIGRYGMGLKEGSFANSEQPTILSRRRGDYPHGYQLSKDSFTAGVLNERAVTKAWNLRHGLVTLSHGTTILWDGLTNVYLGDDSQAGQRFVSQQLEKLRKHIGIRYHRFVESERLNVSLRISWDGEAPTPTPAIRAINPFGYNKSGQRGYPRLLTQGGNPDAPGITAHIWTNRSNNDAFHLEAKDELGHQGFYIYDADRLITQGDWSGVQEPRKELKLLRIDVSDPRIIDRYITISPQKGSVRFSEDFHRFLGSLKSPDDPSITLETVFAAAAATLKESNRKSALHDLECVADHGVGFGVAQHVEVLAGTR
ncbi:ATPase [Corynebacterium humireducens NBRC 106098 = DSM 45392]|uniref:ATPase n=2 Tax=Corynebacterium humireducens TaxID=1223514 RepID=A0A0B5DAG1_9CORY|nr:ATP-binding protein [Corynebacterium humireducens]AJE32704.1 ATPase [Corynebacterium humireducens NBRC 106098 = DSM 45392]